MIFKCKMCGGDLNITDGVNVAECEFCGTKQTVPSADDERKTSLFNRANALRLKCEFDKASGIYESIVADFPEDAEGYWGLVICNYGIEYVDDPASGKKIPTCHRASFDSVLCDDNYKMAIEKSDVIAQKVYRDEAREIERLREEILKKSNSEKPYDIFICYKETDQNGERTVDSVIAQDVYDALCAKGYRVFFSRISLEDKLGQQYEPYIFAALSSAKIMLAFGTKYEYFHAVWVKNEWSRFLKFMVKDADKMLIPCYKDIDPYDMPEEFKPLQAQDMGKLGAIQDLVRGIEKIIGNGGTAAPKQDGSFTASSSTAPLLERVYMFLEDGDFENADAYCEKVLDLEPKNAEAYLGKLLAELRLSKREQLADCKESFENNANYQKALRFNDGALKRELDGYLAAINERLEQERIEKEQRDFELKKLAELERKKQEQKQREQREREAYEREQRELAKREQQQKKKKLIKRAVSVLALSTVIALVANFVVIPISNYSKAEAFLKDGKKAEATIAFYKSGWYKGAKDRSLELWDEIASRETLSADLHTVGLKTDGTVVAVGDNEFGQCNVESWKDIVAISAGSYHTVGLKADGTVVAKGSDMYDQCDVSDWKDVVTVSADSYHTVGLKADGTVFAVGSNGDGRCDVKSWKDIVAISAGSSHTVGLKADGTVFAVGSNYFGQCDVESWKDIVTVSAGSYYTVGLKADGTVVAVGNNEDGQCNVESWKDIVAISAGYNHTVGLKADGTVVAVGYNGEGRCDVENWKDVVTVSAGRSHTVGLKADGTVVAVGWNEFGQCDVENWKNIKLPK